MIEKYRFTCQRIHHSSHGGTQLYALADGNKQHLCCSAKKVTTHWRLWFPADGGGLTCNISLPRGGVDNQKGFKGRQKEIFSTPGVRVDYRTKPVAQIMNCENVEKRYSSAAVIACFSTIKQYVTRLVYPNSQSQKEYKSTWMTSSSEIMKCACLMSP